MGREVIRFRNGLWTMKDCVTQQGLPYLFDTAWHLVKTRGFRHRNESIGVNVLRPSSLLTLWFHGFYHYTLTHWHHDISYLWNRLTLLVPPIHFDGRKKMVRGATCTQPAGIQYCTISHPPPPPPTAGLEEWRQPAIVSTSIYINHNCRCYLMGTGYWSDLWKTFLYSQTAHRLYSPTINKAEDDTFLSKKCSCLADRTICEWVTAKSHLL